MATKKKAAPKKNSLVANINRRKKRGASRSKAKGTVSKKSYDDMQAGWPRAGKKKAAKKKATKKKATKKTSGKKAGVTKKGSKR